jgi:isopenicillin N synthase-like dioxygenase
MADTFSSIPIIDWRRLQDRSTKTAALNDLREAIFVVGFLYLTNHGLEVGVASPMQTGLSNQDRTLFQEHTPSSLSCLISQRMSRPNAT